MIRTGLASFVSGCTLPHSESAGACLARKWTGLHSLGVEQGHPQSESTRACPHRIHDEDYDASCGTRHTSLRAMWGLPHSTLHNAQRTWSRMVFVPLGVWRDLSRSSSGMARFTQSWMSLASLEVVRGLNNSKQDGACLYWHHVKIQLRRQ